MDTIPENICVGLRAREGRLVRGDAGIRHVQETVLFGIRNNVVESRKDIQNSYADARRRQIAYRNRQAIVVSFGKGAGNSDSHRPEGPHCGGLADIGYVEYQEFLRAITIELNDELNAFSHSYFGT